MGTVWTEKNATRELAALSGNNFLLNLNGDLNDKELITPTSAEQALWVEGTGSAKDQRQRKCFEESTKKKK